ncbi:MAG: S8 family serine peptidase [bacterium]
MKENRKIKKFISIYLAISVFCGSLNLPIFVFANEEEGLVDESISVSVDNEIVLPDSNIIDSATSTDVAVFLDISTTTSSVEILDNIETSSTTIEVVAPLIVTINDLSLNNIYLVSESSSTTYESAKEFSKLDISNSLKEKPKINKEELRDKKDKRKKKDYADGEILVKYKSDKINLRTSVGKGDSRNFGKLRSLRKKEDIEKENMSVLEIEDNKSVDDKIIEIQNDPDVEYAQPNYQYYPTEINTDDLDKDLLWGLDNTGQIVNGVEGTKDADISAPEAWSINTGTSSQVIVAIIDSGVSYDHPDLALNMWDGSACVGEDRNGISLNGGCNHGYDYEDNDKTPLPTTSSHGTHIAGIIAGVKNNNKGIVGVSPNAKIMAIKSSLTTSNIIKGINFAKQNGAKIINASWGSPINDRMLKSAISAFPGLFITAAGNDSANNENVHKYPSDYNLDNIISVTATDQNDNLASFSNYGITSVDVGAPGVNIYSTEGERVFDENFKETISPNIGNKFTQSGSNTWGTRDNGLNKTIVGDYEYWGNYRNNITSNLDSLILDLSGKSDSYLNFEISCDTEAGHDGVRLYFWDGASWILQDEYSGALHLIEEKRLSNFATNNFKYRFTWSSDQFNPVPYAGCSIDNIKIIDAGSSGESYQYMSGTSMATPYVSGLASLVWGTKPALSVSEVKNTILNTGDQNPFLLGKTASGRRINAFNALDSITPPLIQDIQVASTTATSTSIVWNTDLPSNSKVVYSTTSPAIFNTASSSALMIKHDLNLSGLSTSTTYYFYAESSDVYGNIATSSERFFTTLPYVESTTTPVVAEVGSVGSYGVSNSTSTAVVDIDRVAPIITVSSYNKLPTNRNIKVNAYVNEGTLNATSIFLQIMVVLILLQ